MSTFTVTSATREVKLGGKPNASVTFTITNTSKKPVRGTPKLKVIGSTGEAWLKISSGGTRNFSPDESQQFVVEITLPANAAPGDYSFGLNISNEALPDEDFTEGPAVAFKIDTQPQPGPKPFPWWILIVVGAVLLVGGGIAIVVAVLPSKIAVPDVTRKQLGEASNSLAIVELRSEVAEQKATGTNQIGIIIGQDPPAGAKVVKGSIIALTVEREADKVPAPDLIGLPPETLQKVYGQLPLKMVQEKKAYTGKQQPGLISEQKPLPGTPVEPKATITYTVEDRKPDDPVPPYVGSWVNENPKATGVARFTISWRDKRAYVHVWAKRGDPTDFGEKEAKVSGNQLETVWNLGIANLTLVMNLEGQRMRVTETSRWMGSSPQPSVVTEFFTPQRTFIQIYKPLALERSAVLSPKFVPK